LAFWSEFAGAFAAQVHSLCASVTAVYLPFFVFGRVLTRLDFFVIWEYKQVNLSNLI